MSSPESVPSAAPLSRLRRWLREPLLHFLLIGAVLFVLYAVRSRGPADSENTRRIVLTDDDLLQMVVAWRAQGLPEPSPAQMQELINSKIREEVLYREALAMGLDKEDTIVKRRMAQKMDFLAEDLSTLREPSRAELQAFFQTNKQDYAYSPRISFRHIYFSFDEHVDKTRETAIAALPKVAGLKADAPEAILLSDAFMFQDAYADQTPGQVDSVFGGKFSKALFALKPGAWSGPIESGFGWHLVFIESLTPGHVPEFEEVEAEVKAEWMANQRAEFKRAAYETMRAKYEVVLPKTTGRKAGGTGANGGNGDEK